MPVYINKSEFTASTGKMYYMWRKKAGRTVVIYLGNRSMDFLEFMDNIKNNCEGLKEIRITSKKSAFIEREIRGYLEGKSKEINLKVEFMTGTKFQKKIWQKLNLVSYGQTISYRKLADMAGYRGAWRPAGSALKSNPVLLAVPCHRVVKSDGSPGRFKGGRKLKKLLLELEKSG